MGGVPARGCTCLGAVPAGGVPAWVGGVYLPGGCTCPGECTCSRGGVGRYPPTGSRYTSLWTEWLTDRCKNITFATSLRTVTIDINPPLSDTKTLVYRGLWRFTFRNPDPALLRLLLLPDLLTPDTLDEQEIGTGLLLLLLGKKIEVHFSYILCDKQKHRFAAQVVKHYVKLSTL